MALRKKHQAITRLGPDLLVVQECESKGKLKAHLNGLKYNQIYWYGNNIHKGVALITFNDTVATPKMNYCKDYEYIIPFDISYKGKKINLLCVWAMQHKTDSKKGYVGQVWGAINYYADDLNSPSIIVGDMNSNAIWDTKNRKGNHSDVVIFLKEKKMSSVYHYCNGYPHGEEQHPTLFLLKKENRPYHIDYCFVPNSMLSRQTTITIGEYSEWIRLSDHMPIIVAGLRL